MLAHYALSAAGFVLGKQSFGIPRLVDHKGAAAHFAARSAEAKAQAAEGGSNEEAEGAEQGSGAIRSGKRLQVRPASTRGGF